MTLYCVYDFDFQFNEILSRMARTYGTAKVCPYSNTNCDLESEGIGLEPGLESIMANSRNYNELAYVWRQWRAATGKLMRTDYNRYVDLSNEAAELNGNQLTSEIRSSCSCV